MNNTSLFQCFGQCGSGSEQNSTRLPLAETAFDSLTPEEQTRVDQDLYGTEEEIEESPDFITCKLADLDEELQLLSEDTRKHYDRAVHMEMEKKQQSVNDEDYITSPKFRLMFLRAERFDARLAARRLARHFKEKLDLFGEEKLSCRITQEDFTYYEDRKALISGGIAYTGAKDSVGRSILIFRRDQVFREDMMSFMRAYFYTVQNVVEENEVSQRKGVILISYNLDARPFVRPSDVRVVFPAIKMVLHALPCRFAGVHSCFDDLKDHWIFNFILVIFPRSVRARFHCHYRHTYMECMLVLRQYGISPDNLPISQEGFRHDMLHEYLRRRRLLEV